MHLPAGVGYRRFFAVWILVGAAWSVGFVGLASIGIFVLPFAALGTVLVRRLDTSFFGAPGVLTGLGIAPLYVAYLNRGGPGDVCTSTATSVSCGQELSPWPWLLIGATLVTVGVVWFMARERRAG